MDIGHPLRSVIPSLDAATLEVLAGTESALGPTQVCRLAGRGSRAGHQKVLDRLTRDGLVVAEPTNKGFVYRFNREHLLAPTVMTALGARTELLSRLERELGRLKPAPLHASVFGSFARREGTVTSDIDLFLVAPDRGPGWESQLQALADRVLAWTGNRLEVLVLDLTQLPRAWDEGEVAIDAVRSEGILLHGRALETLRDRKVTT